MIFPLDKFKTLDTPFYYYDLNVLKNTLEEIKSNVSGVPFKVHYAIKANANDRILSIIRESGLGVDCVSGGELNAAIRKRVAVLNSRKFQNKSFSRIDAFLKYDKPCLKPLPGGTYTVCDYKTVTHIPDNYHVEYDNHYYSVVYTHCGKPAIIKATASEIRICDQYNRLICKHPRAYRELPRYITKDDHMPPEHQYYKEVNQKDGAYYRRWASVFGPNMSEFIDRILKSQKHEEQAYNSCAGLLHTVKNLPHGIVEETARQCIQMNSCRYKTFKQVLNKVQSERTINFDSLPEHENIRGKAFYK